MSLAVKPPMGLAFIEIYWVFPSLSIGIVAYAFTLFLDNLCRRTAVYGEGTGYSSTFLSSVLFDAALRSSKHPQKAQTKTTMSLTNIDYAVDAFRPVYMLMF